MCDINFTVPNLDALHLENNAPSKLSESENTMSGKTAWACFDEDGVNYDDVAVSPFVGSYVLLKNNGEITTEGNETLHTYENS